MQKQLNTSMVLIAQTQGQHNSKVAQGMRRMKEGDTAS